jgi:hypothetical protein
MLVSELQFGVIHPEAGVKTQFHITISTFKSYPSQHKTPFCTLDIQIFSWFVFYATHTILYLSATLRPVISILHLEQAGGKGWSSWWGGLRSKHPSTPCNWCTRSTLCIVCLSFCGWLYLHFFAVTFKYPVSLQRHFLKYLVLRIQLTGTCIANGTHLQDTNAYSKLRLILYSLV